MRGFRVGANAANQASVSPGVWAPVGPTVEPSSAVPVLPATDTPGIAAAVPVPCWTTPTISVSTIRATRFDVTWMPRDLPPCSSSVGRWRMPWLAIVSATTAISSGVASTLPLPIAGEPTASGGPPSAAGGSVEGAAPGTDGVSLKPYRSAAPTSFFAPTFTPSGANTELHDSAKDWANVPPHDSPFAFERLTPSITACVSTGNVEDVLTALSSSAAVAVIILKVDPGGC